MKIHKYFQRLITANYLYRAEFFVDNLYHTFNLLGSNRSSTRLFSK